MTKLWPEFDAFVNDVVESEFVQDIINVWEGDSLENVLTDDPELAGSSEDLASKLEDDFQAGEPLPSYLDPNIELNEIGETVTDLAKAIVTKTDFGFGKDNPSQLWPLGLGLTAALVIGIAVCAK